MSESAPPSGDRLSQRPTASAPPSGREPTADPLRIGPYRILEKRGDGGMGIVYLAEQTEPVKRHVALKVIKLGMDSSLIIARFEAERQALAMMDHPAIASIYAAGTTAEGRPYFVMEFVPGVPITEHCDRSNLSNRERIELFIQVCEGVQHAHQKAVIHRDLKPSNVLVSNAAGRPFVKIIDFGLAKALERPLTERTLQTELGMMVGTLEYMSPEQADTITQDVDTRSDVYSLGVMLYEILVGVLPFGLRQLRQAPLDETLRRIRTQDPPRPSARVTASIPHSGEWARRRGTVPKALQRELKGDLDWITMRALEKDRARRYGSPTELADDLRRFLKFEPVRARAPSTRYRALKFVRRHRLAVTAAAVMAVSLAAGTIGLTVGFVRARQAETRAVTEAQAKERVADFLKDLFKVSDPGEARGNTITARELLDKAAGTLDSLSDQPVAQAELASIMGEVYLNLGLYEPAESLFGKALDLRKSALGEEHPETLQAMNNLGTVLGYRGRHEDSAKLRNRTLEIQERVLGPEHPETLASMMNLAGVYHRAGDYPEAERRYSEVLAIQKRVMGPEHRDTLRTMYNLALLYVSQARLPEAEKALEEVVAADQRVLGLDHPSTLMSMEVLAKVYLQQERYAEAERLLTEVLEKQRHVLGPEHPDVLNTMTNLALVNQGQGRYAEAERISLETLEIQKRVMGPEHEAVLWSMNNIALSYQSVGRFDDAERLHLETLAIRRRVFGPRHPDTLASLYNLACVSARRGDRAKAMVWLRQDVEGGDIDADTMAGDAELESLHGPEFDALLEQVRRNAVAARAAGGQ